MRYRRRRSAKPSRFGSRSQINAAVAFSESVANTDHLVKDAFFSLSGRARRDMLDDYQRIYGAEARKYAEQTTLSWQFGHVSMSTQTARRLFALIPPRMEPAQRYKIVEAIWNRYDAHARSKYYVFFGRDTDGDALIGAVQGYFRMLDVSYPIPEELERQFTWLAGDDVNVKKHLLHHFKDERSRIAIESARLHLATILQGESDDCDYIRRDFRHTIIIGGHHLEMKADLNRSGFNFSEYGDDYAHPKKSVRVDAVRKPLKWKVCWLTAGAGVLYFCASLHLI